MGLNCYMYIAASDASIIFSQHLGINGYTLIWGRLYHWGGREEKKEIIIRTPNLLMNGFALIIIMLHSSILHFSIVIHHNIYPPPR